jgi:azurin
LIAGTLALAGSSAFAATQTAVTVTTGDQTTYTAADIKAERDKCKTLPGSDQARCMDSVGITTYSGEREGTVTDDMGSLQSRDKCDLLRPEDKRECLINDKAG